MIRTDQVSTLKVEAVQLVASLLRIHDVLIDNEGSALGVRGNALADLAAECVSPELGDASSLQIKRTG